MFVQRLCQRRVSGGNGALPNLCARVRSDGVMMLVRRRLSAGVRFSLHNMYTRMGRCLLVAHMKVNGEQVRLVWVAWRGGACVD